MKQLIISILVMSTAAAQARTGPPANDAEPLRRAAAAVTDIMVHDIFSPPVASRIYLYTSVAAYETLAKGEWREYASLHGQVKGLPAIPDPQGKISFPLAAVYAYLLVGKKLIFSESVMEDSIRSILSWYRSSDPAVYAASLEYGRQVAAVVIAWAGTDQYAETRRLPRYRLLRQKGKWIPTPPVYMAAVEPYWNKIRPVTLDSADQFRPLPAPAFSTDTASLFYHQAYEVYQAGNTLTQEQKDIANFWDCNPFAVTMEGHVGFATKKISPGGHWMSIVTTVSRQRRLDIMETAAAYTITSIAIFDAFISCWAEKYRSNVIRPETYIDSYIAEGWRPLLQTPPFPEYTSGHSIVSMVSATVLTHYFGDHFAFDDDTEIAFGLPQRHFDSFLQAAQEAAISRFYGGIHYHAAIVAGVTSGQQIGQWVLNKIILKKQSRPIQVLHSTSSYVPIMPTDSPADIIRKAAHVVPSPRQLRWQELELTAFFHFGINTFTDREWGDGKEDLSVFNPTQLDARQWIRVAKAAGIRQVILTAKHHDGFCLWPSQYTDHTIKNTPYKDGHGDIVKEFADACKEYGMGFGLYLSPWDRNSPVYGDSAKYNDLFMHWLTELLTNYGKVDEVWFDGANGEGPNGKKQVYAFEAWYHLIRHLQPQAVIAIMGPDVRWVGTETGQGRLTEWSVLPLNANQQASIAANSQKDMTFAPIGNLMNEDLGSRQQLMSAKGLIWYPAETDVSIRPGWFYHDKEDAKVRTPAGLMDLYFSSVGRNSVLLLNIPPNRQGLISDADVRSLQGWRKDMDATFGVNLAAGAAVSSPNGVHPHALLDGKSDTWWTTTGDDTTATITFALSGGKTFDVLSLQEEISVGQRVEKFVLESYSGGQWTEIASGTTIGYKRLIHFPPVTARSVRLRILSSRCNPTIAEFGLYKLVE